LNVAAESAAMVERMRSKSRLLRQLVAETGACLARHYRHYDFLLALTDHLAPNAWSITIDDTVPERTPHMRNLMETQMDLAAA